MKEPREEERVQGVGLVKGIQVTSPKVLGAGSNMLGAGSKSLYWDIYDMQLMLWAQLVQPVLDAQHS